MFNKIKIIKYNYLLKLILINIFILLNYSNVYCFEIESQVVNGNNTSSILLIFAIGLIGFSIGYGVCYLYNRSNNNNNNDDNQNQGTIDSNNNDNNNDNQNTIDSNNNDNDNNNNNQNTIDSNNNDNQNTIDSNNNDNNNNNQNTIDSNIEINLDQNSININLENLISEDSIFMGPSNYDILQLGLDQLTNITDLFSQNHFNLQYLTELPLLQEANLSNSTLELNNIVLLLNSIQKKNLEIYKLLDNINSLYLLYLNGN